MAAAIKELNYRTLDQLIDAVRIDLQSFQSAGDIDTSTLIKIALAINYELGLKILQLRETMLEVSHHKAKLPADFNQAILALSCFQWRQVQNAPWNGNVLLEQLPEQCSPAGCHDNTTAQPKPNCDICNVTHIGDCPEIVRNPYPMGKCRTICNDQINIKILQYCESEVRCYEQFQRLWIEPHILASGFDPQGRFNDGYVNRGSISKGFLYTEGMECGKVYLYYMGAMEDEDGNLLVLDHDKINLYYEWAIKYAILENLWLNGEDMLQRMQYAEKKVEEYRHQALSIANTADFRQVMRNIQVLKGNHDRQYWKTISRYYGYLGCVNPVDTYGHW